MSRTQVPTIGRVDRLPLAEEVTPVAWTNVTGTFRAFLPHMFLSIIRSLIVRDNQ